MRILDLDGQGEGMTIGAQGDDRHRARVLARQEEPVEPGVGVQDEEQGIEGLTPEQGGDPVPPGGVRSQIVSTLVSLQAEEQAEVELDKPVGVGVVDQPARGGDPLLETGPLLR